MMAEEPQRRSLADLDEVIEEIIERNPKWCQELFEFIKNRIKDDGKNSNST